MTEPILASESTSASTCTEEVALNLLKSRDLQSEQIEALNREHRTLLSQSSKLRRAVVEHPNTPRRLSLPLLRQLFTFDLMQIALAPPIVGDLRIAAEDQLIRRLDKISAGEKTTLAKRASGRVAGALLEDGDQRVIGAALENGRLTEAMIVKALTRPLLSASLVMAVGLHPKWGLRRDVRTALLLNAQTPEEQALNIARTLPPQVVRQTLDDSHLPEEIKLRILQEIAS